MSRFTSTLRQTSSRLNIPQPARSRVLLELAADMEDLFEVYRSRGLSDEKAHQQTLENIDLSDDSLDALASVHSSPIRKFMYRISDRVLARWEKFMLILLVLAVVFFGGNLARGGQVIADASLFVWPILLTALAALLLSLSKFYNLYIKQDHRCHRLRSGLDIVLNLALLQIVLAFFGSWWQAMAHSIKNNDDTGELVRAMFAWMIQATALIQIGLGLALLCALAWFLLASKVGQIERDEATIMLDV